MAVVAKIGQKLSKNSGSDATVRNIEQQDQSLCQCQCQSGEDIEVLQQSRFSKKKIWAISKRRL